MIRVVVGICALGLLIGLGGDQGLAVPTDPGRRVALGIVPGGQGVAVGDRIRFALVARYEDGSVRDLSRAATWRSSSGSVVRLSRDGRAHGIARGKARVTATLPGGHAETTVEVGARSLGPLRVSTANPRYFQDRAGRVIYLAGDGTWSNLQDNGTTDPPPKFDYTGYLTFLQAHGMGMFRLYSWEQATWTGEIKGKYFLSPNVYLRTGPGNAKDGKPRFDLRRFNPAYFSRLRQRVIAARERGIYVIVMLFDGWSVDRKGDGENPWDGHPFNGANNINGVNGDLDHDGFGTETQTLADPRVTGLQEAYVRRVLQAVDDQPNVLYEISNESDADSVKWQNHMVEFVRSHEPRGRRHPVGITAMYPGGDNADLFASSADWVSPSGDVLNLAPATGAKVVIADTDHLCGVCGHDDFPWSALTRGLNPQLMDLYDGKAIGLGALDADERDPRWEILRRRLGVTEQLSQSLDMARLVPAGDLASTGYCLADVKRGTQYVVYLPRGGDVTVDLSASPATMSAQWVDPDTGVVTSTGSVAGRGKRSFSAPGNGDAVLVLRAGP